MRVTNRGHRKWEVSPRVYVRAGESVNVTSDEWRLALVLNPAMPYAVASGEIAVEDEAPQTAPAVVPEPEPEYVEPVAEVATVITQPRQQGGGKRRR